MPADQSIGLPPNTVTIMTVYEEYRGGRRVAIAETHHYQQRGGGNFRTRPDPKMIVTEEGKFILDPGQ
jgi:hypothetical protein